VFEQREAARGDRKIGLARFQSARVHGNSEYDVEVDTRQLSPNQGAQKIISAPEAITPPTAFECLRPKETIGAPPIPGRGHALSPKANSSGYQPPKAFGPGPETLWSQAMRFPEITVVCGPEVLPKTACSARGGVLYTELARFATLAVQGGA
jgi:hypothetical protein